MSICPNCGKVDDIRTPFRFCDLCNSQLARKMQNEKHPPPPDKYKVAMTRCCNKVILACAIDQLDLATEQQFIRYKSIGLIVRTVVEVGTMGLCECDGK